MSPHTGGASGGQPWGAIEPIPTGAKFALHYDPPGEREDTSLIEYHSGMIRFWVDGESYELEIDGKPIPT